MGILGRGFEAGTGIAQVNAFTKADAQTAGNRMGQADQVFIIGFTHIGKPGTELIDIFAAQRAVWEKIDIPILILRGSESGILTQEVLEEMLRRNPNAESHVFEGIGHAPPLMSGDQIDVVLDFLAKYLGVKKNTVAIISGHTSPVKHVQVSGISAEVLLKKLDLDK